MYRRPGDARRQHHQRIRVRPARSPWACAAYASCRSAARHVAADVCLRRVRLAQVAAQPGERRVAEPVRPSASARSQGSAGSRAARAGCRSRVLPDRVPVEIERILAGQQALRLTTEDRGHLRVVEPDLVGVAGDHRRDHER